MKINDPNHKLTSWPKMTIWPKFTESSKWCTRVWKTVFNLTCDVIGEADVNETWFPRHIFQKFLMPLETCKSGLGPLVSQIGVRDKNSPSIISCHENTSVGRGLIITDTSCAQRTNASIQRMDMVDTGSCESLRILKFWMDVKKVGILFQCTVGHYPI